MINIPITIRWICLSIFRSIIRSILYNRLEIIPKVIDKIASIMLCKITTKNIGWTRSTLWHKTISDLSKKAQKIWIAMKISIESNTLILNVKSELSCCRKHRYVNKIKNKIVAKFVHKIINHGIGTAISITTWITSIVIIVIASLTNLLVRTSFIRDQFWAKNNM